MKLQLTTTTIIAQFVFAVLIWLSCVLIAKFDCPDKATPSHNIGVGQLPPVHIHNQGSLTVWRNGGKWNIIPDSSDTAQAPHKDCVPLKLTHKTGHNYEPEPIDIKRFMCQLATIRKYGITGVHKVNLYIEMSDADSAIFVDTASALTLRQVDRWVR